MARKQLVLGIAAASSLVVAPAIPAHAGSYSATVPPRTAPPTPAPQPVERAAGVQKQLKMSLGSRFGGAWVEHGSKVVVATTDAASTAKIKAAGATPKLVKFDAGALDSAHATLNRHARSAPRSVASWYVDAETNRVVVQASSTSAARRFVQASGVDAAKVQIVRSTARPRLVHDIVGGERYWTTQYGCSVAFSVDGGFLTAGHCGKQGERTEGGNRVAQGTFGGSSFPGDDYAWVDTNDQWTPTPKVNKHDGTFQTIRGAVEAPVGTRVCRSGGTTSTQIWCGPIKQRNVTVNYQEGAVSGLISAGICADPGDSGGALFTEEGQAQGITSGTSGSCDNGQDSRDVTYFQPVSEVLQILARDGRELVTEGGGPGPGACGEYDTKLTGSLTSGGSDYQPGDGYTTTTSGAHTACLDGPDGVDFDVYLQKLNGGTWQTVAYSISPTPDETIDYNGTAGTYRYRVHAYGGNGDYHFGFSRP
ncbi:S1 family peptidase [Actinomadura spongiicola]|uniref:S1 family peptidase n=1 Tax=Actinomadura spongiicola TaxID=2303421 RepID=A0A372GI66_9ACTN|nr:S1 family peptidase [Actinomadura spongiicola]RFS85047.1 S1 family peptidase [Actinomadura spongiicola]